MDFTEFQKSLEGLSDEEKTNKHKELYESKTKLETDVEFQKNEAKKAFEKRDATKKEIDSLTVKIKELESKGTNSDELETLKKEKEDLIKERDSYKSQIDQINESTKKELLEMLPEGDVRKLGEKLGLAELREYVKLHTIPPHDRSRSVRKPGEKTDKTPEEKIQGMYK